MAKDFLKSDPIADTKALIQSDFNTVIRKTHASLTTKKHSPVYTGFFASSWKAANTPPKATQKVKDYKPWSEFAQIGKKKPYNPPSLVKARFPVTRVFNINKAVFIGNKAKYAAYALEGGKIQNFVQGRLAQIIRDNMKEKKGKLFLLGAKEQTAGFGSAKSSIGYSDVL
tara:strand:+ start:226 stop:735 length:510 start_codon:yes stop_codon:yes gene_type:complete